MLTTFHFMCVCIPSINNFPEKFIWFNHFASIINKDFKAGVITKY